MYVCMYVCVCVCVYPPYSNIPTDDKAGQVWSQPLYLISTSTDSVYRDTHTIVRGNTQNNDNKLGQAQLS